VFGQIFWSGLPPKFARPSLNNVVMITRGKQWVPKPIFRSFCKIRFSSRPPPGAYPPSQNRRFLPCSSTHATYSLLANPHLFALDGFFFLIVFYFYSCFPKRIVAHGDWLWYLLSLLPRFFFLCSWRPLPTFSRPRTFLTRAYHRGVLPPFRTRRGALGHIPRLLNYPYAGPSKRHIMTGILFRTYCGGRPSFPPTTTGFSQNFPFPSLPVGIAGHTYVF